MLAFHAGRPLPECVDGKIPFTTDFYVMENEPFISTGLTELDRALGDKLTPGNVIGVISGSGGGKTVLATQIVRHALDYLTGNQILLLSTEAHPDEYWLRNLSAACSIPYPPTRRDGDLIEDSDGNLWPNYRKYGGDAVIAAKRSREQFYELKIHRIPQTEDDVPQKFSEHLKKFQADLGDSPGLVVVDYLNWPSFELNAWAARSSMLKSMEVIQAAATTGNLLIIVFAQATQKSIGKRRLTQSDIADCKDLFGAADAFAAISQEYGSDPRDGDEGGPPLPYRKSQTIMVSLTAEGPISKRVPVTRRFEFQRFEDREETYNDPYGYLPFSRSRFRELSALTLKSCINVYLYLAFWSRFDRSDEEIGTSWPCHERIANATGLSLKQVRTAAERLAARGLVTVKRTATTNRYTILGWEMHHDTAGAAKVGNDYVRLSRGLLNKPDLEIFPRPPLLRLWIYIIMNTQMFHDRKQGELHRGCIRIDFDDIEHEIGLREAECLDLLSFLESRGSIEKLDGIKIKVLYRVTNWDRYQPDV